MTQVYRYYSIHYPSTKFEPRARPPLVRYCSAVTCLLFYVYSISCTLDCNNECHLKFVEICVLYMRRNFFYIYTHFLLNTLVVKFYRFEFPETSATSDVFIIDPFQMQQMKKEKQVDDAG